MGWINGYVRLPLCFPSLIYEMVTTVGLECMIP